MEEVAQQELEADGGFEEPHEGDVSDQKGPNNDRAIGRIRYDFALLHCNT